MAPDILEISFSSCAPSVEHTSPFDPETPATDQAEGAISGTVRLERAGDDASGALVSLAGTASTAVTDAADGTGNFTMSGLAAG